MLASARAVHLAGGGRSGERLYQRLARCLFHDLAAGEYAMGERLPAERELSVEHDASRPCVREAVIALRRRAANDRGHVEPAVRVTRMRVASEQGVDQLLFTTAAQAMEEARRSVADERARYAPLDVATI